MGRGPRISAHRPRQSVRRRQAAGRGLSAGSGRTGPRTARIGPRATPAAVVGAERHSHLQIHPRPYRLPSPRCAACIFPEDRPRMTKNQDHARRGSPHPDIGILSQCLDIWKLMPRSAPEKNNVVCRFGKAARPWASIPGTACFGDKAGARLWVARAGAEFLKLPTGRRRARTSPGVGPGRTATHAGLRGSDRDRGPPRRCRR